MISVSHLVFGDSERFTGLKNKNFSLKLAFFRRQKQLRQEKKQRRKIAEDEKLQMVTKLVEATIEDAKHISTTVQETYQNMYKVTLSTAVSG